MFSYNSSLLFRRCLSSAKKPCYNRRRITTSSSSNKLIDDWDNSVIVERNACSRTTIINRPSSLNAFNVPMVAKLVTLYQNWEEDPNIKFIVLKGKGRAFCAGGDVVSLYNLIKQDNLQECKKLIQMAYSLVYLVATSMKPHVALLNGITMGGGAGISILGTFRVATDKTGFATPETLIGFHPDAGASFYLSHLPGHLGEYLAMTGETLNGAEMISCGLATHYSHAAKLPLIENQLKNLASGNTSAIEACLRRHGDPACLNQTSILHRMETLDKCFSHETVEEIIESLENETGKEFCVPIAKKLRGIAPLSLKVALRSIREGRHQSLEECLMREYRMSLQALSGQVTNDFCEGVRARLVDKDFAPTWDPPRLEQVSQDMVDRYFSSLSPIEPELQLPIKHKHDPFTQMV